MALSQDQAVAIYAAAKDALHAAAEQAMREISAEHLDDDPDALNAIARQALAAAGRAAFKKSTKAAKAYVDTERPVLGIQVIKTNRDTEYHLEGASMSAPEFGLMIADIVRHGAKAMKIDEATVWEWVDREHRYPTSGVNSAAELGLTMSAYMQLLNKGIPLEACPQCGARPFRPFLRGHVQNWWRRLWRKPYCCLICAACQEVVGYEKP